MPNNEELKYKLTVEKNTAAAGEVKKEISDIDKGLKDDIPQASDKAGSAYESFIKKAKSISHELHDPIAVFHRLLGSRTFVVGPLILLWELYKNRQLEVARATAENRDKHLDLIRAYRLAQDAGVDLTETEKAHKKALEDLAKVEGGNLATALSKRNIELEKSIGITKENIRVFEAVVKSGDTGGETIADYGDQVKKAKERLATLNEELTRNKVDMEAAGKAAKGATDLLDQQTKVMDAKRKIMALEASARASNAQASLDIERAKNQEIMGNALSTGQEKIKAVSTLAAAELAEVQRASDDRKAILESEKMEEKLGAEIQAAQIAQLTAETEAKKTDIKARSSEARKKIEQEEANKIRMNVQQVSQSFLGAFNQRMKQTHDLGEAVKAGADAALDVAVQEAQKYAVIKAIEAAEGAYAWGSAWGGPVAGGIAAAAAFSGVMAIGAAIGAGGAALSSGLSPSGGGSSSGGPGGGGSGPFDTSSGSPFQNNVGKIINIHVSGADYIVASKVARVIAEEIKRMEAS